MSDQKQPFLGRREFVKGIAAASVILPLTTFSPFAWAYEGSKSELNGNTFDLEIASIPVNFTGKARIATVVNSLLPGPVLKLKEGDTVTIRVSNRLEEMCTIHWHGIILDSGMDGVPGISFPGIEPGETFVHKFKVVQHGTYWYHAHTLAEQTGVYGALIIEPRDTSNEIPVDRDYPVILSDWTDENPVDVYMNLKKMAGYYNYRNLTALDFIDDAAHLGIGKALSNRHIWNKTRMSPNDFSDRSGSQIIAAEKLRRRCRALEISPAFVDVAVERWEKATGKDALLEGPERRTHRDVALERKGPGEAGPCPNEEAAQ